MSPKASLLVIDDDDAWRALIAEILAGEGYDVQSAPDGPTGVALARAQPPDLVVCDVLMPVLDGYGVLSKLREDPATALTPFIFLTGLGDESSIRAGMERGADDYLSKLAGREQLLRAIETRLARTAAARAQAQRTLAELRSTIVRSLPHEFLTPLTAVLGLSTLLMDEQAEMDGAAVRDAARAIFQGGRRLQELAEKFLLYAELEVAGRDPRLRRENAARPPFPVKSAIEQSARECARRLEREQDLTLAVEDLALALAKDHLTVLVRELVENACLFSRPRSSVAVALERDGDQTRLSVRDQGRGLSPDQLAQLGAFIQIDRLRHEQPGAGLGLGIVRLVTELYCGRIAFENELPQGLAVRVWLPLPAAQP